MADVNAIATSAMGAPARCSPLRCASPPGKPLPDDKEAGPDDRTGAHPLSPVAGLSPSTPWH